jgi:hypothetical protein
LRLIGHIFEPLPPFLIDNSGQFSPMNFTTLKKLGLFKTIALLPIGFLAEGCIYFGYPHLVTETGLMGGLMAIFLVVEVIDLYFLIKRHYSLRNDSRLLGS